MTTQNMLGNVSPIEPDNDLPIALRRQKRNSVGAPKDSDDSYFNNPRSRTRYGVETPPPTPKRLKKRVRFSDPGPRSPSAAKSSGLTPFMRKTSLSGKNSPASRRRHSTPVRALSWDYSPPVEPLSGIIQFEPLRDVLDDRVKRRLKRNGLSEELNSIESEKRQESNRRRSEVETLTKQLEEKDVEMQALRDELALAKQLGVVDDDATISDGATSCRVQTLEDEILKLKAELQSREADEAREQNEYWTLANHTFGDGADLADFDEDDAVPDIDSDDIFCRSPSRRKSHILIPESAIWTRPVEQPLAVDESFPSPPSTQPNTPVSRHSSTVTASAQASLPDPEVTELQCRLATLREEMTGLAAKVESASEYQHRLVGKLAPFINNDNSDETHVTLDIALDEVLTALTLAQSSVVESTQRFKALTSEIRQLGFPDENIDTTITLIASQFHDARVELERLIPGEQTIGFENDKLLELLIDRVRLLVERVAQQDDEIDQYHAQELSLRQQLGARIDGMEIVRNNFDDASVEIAQLRNELEEYEESNSRLQLALTGYRDEVQQLEQLIMTMEGDHAVAQEHLRQEATAAIQACEENLQTERCEHEASRAQIDGQHLIITGLTARLDSLMSTSRSLQEEVHFVTEERQRAVEELQSRLEELIAQRPMDHDGVSEREQALQRQLESAQAALKEAQDQAIALSTQNEQLEAQLKDLQTNRGTAVATMKSQIEAVLSTLATLDADDVVASRDCAAETTAAADPKPGAFLKPELVRKKKKTQDRASGATEAEAVAVTESTEAMELCGDEA